MQGKTISELQVGDFAEFTKTISEADIYLFAGVTGDLNPAHINEEYAKNTFFKTRIAHGGLPHGLIAPVWGTKLPGLGTIALEIKTRFKAPTYPGDTITATTEVIEKLEERKWLRMKLTWTNQKGEIVGTGEGLVMPPPKLK